MMICASSTDAAIVLDRLLPSPLREIAVDKSRTSVAAVVMLNCQNLNPCLQYVIVEVIFYIAIGSRFC